jgi:hypothetical protein
MTGRGKFTATGLTTPNGITSVQLVDNGATLSYPAAIALNSVDVPGCGKGLWLVADWSENIDGTQGQHRTARTGRADGLGSATGHSTWQVSGSTLSEQGEFICGTAPSPPPSTSTTATGAVAVDFATQPDPSAGDQWHFEKPVCMISAPTDCLGATPSWDTTTGSLTGNDVRLTVSVEQNGQSSPGAVSLVVFNGTVAGCGTGSFYLIQWSTTTGTAGWNVISPTASQALTGLTGAGTVDLSSTGNHYRGAIRCGTPSN